MDTDRILSLIKVATSGSVQTASQTSFVGGRPKLPSSFSLPTCKLCGEIQSFFFQVAFPEPHPWAGRTLAVFQCTSCHNNNHLVPLIRRKLFPAMTDAYLRPGEEILNGLLELVQVRVRFLTFPTADGVVRDDYSERVRYRPISFEQAFGDERTTKSKIGGQPGWVEDDESPGPYMGKPLIFLMQWRMNFKFKLVPDAPPPFDPMMDVIPQLKDVREYDLFLAKQAYFFGNDVDGSSNIYLCTQRD